MGKPWTATEIQYLRDNHGKLTTAEMAQALVGRTPGSVTARLTMAKISNIHSPVSCGGVPMERVLPPAQCDKMRSFLRAYLHYSKTYGHISATRFLHAWRKSEFGFTNAGNWGRKVKTGGQQ